MIPFPLTLIMFLPVLVFLAFAALISLSQTWVEHIRFFKMK